MINYLMDKGKDLVSSKIPAIIYYSCLGRKNNHCPYWNECLWW